MKCPDGYRCARCGHDEARLEFVERVYDCKRCRKQESVKSGTIFEHTKLPLWKWFMAIWFMVGDKRGISATRLSKYIESLHVKTDNASVYNVLKKMGFQHESIQTIASLRVGEQPWVHRMISLAKRFVPGTYHGVSKAYFQRYLDEFCYRMNRRYEGGKNIIMRFIADCVRANPIKISGVRIQA